MSREIHPRHSDPLKEFGHLSVSRILGDLEDHPIDSEIRQGIGPSAGVDVDQLTAGATGLLRTGLFAGLAAGAALLALGRHFVAYDLVTTLVPWLKILRYPEKVMVVTALGWALLAGSGFDAWRAG